MSADDAPNRMPEWLSAFSKTLENKMDKVLQEQTETKDLINKAVQRIDAHDSALKELRESIAMLRGRLDKMESGPASLASGCRSTSLPPSRNGMGSRRVSFDGDSMCIDSEPSAKRRALSNPPAPPVFDENREQLVNISL
eukprot:6461882-Amphidinium_carterae.2